MATGSRKTYSYETKLASVRAHLEEGKTAVEAMEENGVLSKSAYFRWCAEYVSNGADALVPRHRGRPRRD
ncbi:MAG: helix-turn-helix domain-containing protein [Atopobiaceae bacterium]|jgi:transposase|nr:helix-turn-helix domain-containing protein [Atopobiaceae bacterium]